MKTIEASGYNYNERGTAWVVQRVKFEDWGDGIDVNAKASFMVLASFPDYDKAHHYFENHCSGLQDDECICGNQNHGSATFYRIVEVHEGCAR